MITNAFTCTGPYAILIMLGVKRVENRSMMPVPSKGRCAVSCSKSFNAAEYGAFVQWAERALPADLKKQLPRLPVPVSMDDYKLMVKVGRDLAALHLHYEDIEGYGLKEVKTAGKVSYEVKKLSWGKKGKEEDRTKIIVNETLTLEGIPAKAHEYVVNGRTGLEWIIERYQMRTDAESGITNDPNDWGKEHGNPRYIVDLIQSVTAVSVKTVDLVKKLDAIKLRSAAPNWRGVSDTPRQFDRAEPRILREIGEELKYRSYLPVYSLRAACGPLADGEVVEPEGWVNAEGHGKLDETQFVVKTEGVSMEGLIPEGAYAIFRKLGGGNLAGKTLLIQRNDASDPEGGGAYTIKRFTRQGSQVVLKATNPKYDIALRDEAEYSTTYRALAEFKAVLQ